ncbi:SusC/RagA family TonB-linked outer membrane protein [Mucilaginibacter paludis]|uniref:TonB-dependent receptor plug n=1 Tax=Mucilaginibacter paludis DSM 18603 TaxID=714943 RepID=H1Y6W1_9SPHI|nr:SusC/RagA family TonB-linked outer membrane protein [Mucilaginibacter paludis]EHQ28368.1 TonB-dependent receptor plug [Mucilaginibacter paludis DSM 18603]
MKKNVLTILLFGLFALNSAFAQSRKITGKVTSADDHQPLPGVSVKIQGTTRGTQTDGQGVYNIDAPADVKSLVFTYIGFTSQTVAVNGRTTIDVVLATDAKQLGEVVVTALGLEKDKRSINYTTQQISGAEISDKGEPSVLNALQGKVSGVQITGASGGAGASTNINIRGISSFTGNNQPLFVIDGVTISNDVDRTNGGSLGTLGDNQPSNRALDINPDNIESITILKGGAAAALYGSRAGQGVVVITTKKGLTNKKSEITITSSLDRQKAYGLMDLQNDYGQGSLGVYNPASANSWGPKFGSTPSVINGLIDASGNTVPYKAYPNNIKNYFNTGFIANNSVSIANGTKDQNVFLSAGNTRQDGILPNTNLNRTNVLMNFNSVLANKLRYGASGGYTATHTQGVLGGNGSSAVGSLVNIPRSYDLQGLPYIDPVTGANVFFLSGTDNPYFDAYQNPLISDVSRFTGNVNAAYDIAPWLTVSYKLGLDTYTDRRKQIFAKTSARVPNGQVLQDMFYRQEINSDLIITAKKKDFFIKNFNASALLGQNLNQRKYENTTLQADNLTLPGFYNVSNGTTLTNGSQENSTIRRLLGFYTQLSFDYDNYLFLELTGRADKSSTLPVNSNTYFYPGASIGFVFTDAFKIQSKILSYGKLKASVAKVGNDANPYSLQAVYVVPTYGNNVAGDNFPFTVGGATYSGFTQSATLRDASLKPEFITSYEFGANLGFLNNRINLDVTYFHSKTTNNILSLAIPTSTGYNSYYTNSGSLSNRGIEVLLTGTPIKSPNFSWDVNFNFTRIRNKVESIAQGLTSFPIPGSAFTGSIPSIVIDQPYGVIVGSTNLKTADGQFVINPATGTFTAGPAGQVLANPNPNFTSGFNNTFTYKGVHLSFLIDMQQGGDIVSFTAAFNRSRGAAKETAVDRELPHIIPGVIQNADGSYRQNNIQISAQTYWQAFGLQNDNNVFDATVYRFRELSLGYSLPKSILNRSPFGSVTISIIGRNLFYYAPNAPFDPEVNTQGAGNIRGLELQSAPNARSYGFNVKLTL